jgi:hypothetical protein
MEIRREAATALSCRHRGKHNVALWAWLFSLTCNSTALPAIGSRLSPKSIIQVHRDSLRSANNLVEKPITALEHLQCEIRPHRRADKACSRQISKTQTIESTPATLLKRHKVAHWISSWTRQKQKFAPNNSYSLLHAICPRGLSRHLTVLAQPVQGLMLTEAAQFEMADFKDRCRNFCGKSTSHE